MPKTEMIDHCTELLYEALASPAGLLLKTNDPGRARAALYTARRKAEDRTLAGLQFRFCPPQYDGDLMIVKGPMPDEKKGPELTLSSLIDL